MADPLPTTPVEDGFRMPAEWEPHARTWMLWPTRPDVWREGAGPAQTAYAQVAEAIARFEPVTLGVLPGHLDQARALLPPGVEAIPLEYNDAWIRDMGPTFLVNDQGELRGVHWRFNAWGGHYADWSADEEVGRRVLELAGAPRYRADLVMEGGALHVDGEGTLLVVEECLLHPSRNPHLSKAEIEARLRAFLGVETVIWLPWGVAGDETNGHVDNLCCFVEPGRVALTWTDDVTDPQHERSAAAEAVLAQARDARGRRLEVVRIHQPGPLCITAEEAATIQPMPGSRPRQAGDRLAASYINHYLVNGGVIAPLFDDPRDEEALALLAQLYPGREVVGVPGREILLGGGNVHCITQQQPRGRGDTETWRQGETVAD